MTRRDGPRRGEAPKGYYRNQAGGAAHTPADIWKTPLRIKNGDGQSRHLHRSPTATPPGEEQTGSSCCRSARPLRGVKTVFLQVGMLFPSCLTLLPADRRLEPPGGGKRKHISSGWTHFLTTPELFPSREALTLTLRSPSLFGVFNSTVTWEIVSVTVHMTSYSTALIPSSNICIYSHNPDNIFANYFWNLVFPSLFCDAIPPNCLEKQGDNFLSWLSLIGGQRVTLTGRASPPILIQ